MQLNVAIAGYGNLGKSLEKHVLADNDLRLTAVFSRRNIDNKLHASFDDAPSFAATTDVVLIALGSLNDIAQNAHFFKQFHTVDSFDVHAQLPQHKQMLNNLKGHKISLCAAGWDPGVLSIVRGLWSLGKGKTTTFWGDGISQGHSYALRTIKGVLDAVEITQPNPTAVDETLHGKFIAENLRHNRLCYVACVESDKRRIEEEICAMPNYFQGQNVKIVFCTPAEVRKVKEETQHSGRVIAIGQGFFSDTKLHVESNTDYTAKIMLAYAKAVPQLARDGYTGALSPFDVPLKYLASESLV